MIDDLYSLKYEFDQSGIIACFSGPLSQEMLSGLGNTLKQEMESANATQNTRIKVFAVLVELMQNMINYSAEKIVEEAQDIRFGLIAIGVNEHEYTVLCGNKIENHKIEKLTEYLNMLSSLDKDQLKQLYKEKRRQDPHTEDSKGAGLGFIEIARKSSRPFEYDIKTIDEDYSFFSMKTYI